LFHNFVICAPDDNVFLRAPDLRYAAEQPRLLTTSQDTATNRRHFSSDIYISPHFNGHFPGELGLAGVY